MSLKKVTADIQDSRGDEAQSHVPLQPVVGDRVHGFPVGELALRPDQFVVFPGRAHNHGAEVAQLLCVNRPELF